MNMLVIWLSSSLLIYLTALIVPGFQIRSFGRAMIAAVAIGLLNAFLRPILILITIPINILTLGLFTFVVNAIILKLSASLIKGFEIKSWGSAILAAFTMSLLQIAAQYLFG